MQNETLFVSKLEHLDKRLAMCLKHMASQKLNK